MVVGSSRMKLLYPVHVELEEQNSSPVADGWLFLRLSGRKEPSVLDFILMGCVYHMDLMQGKQSEQKLKVVDRWENAVLLRVNSLP